MPTLSAMMVKISVFFRCLFAGEILTGLGAGALVVVFFAMMLSIRCAGGKRLFSEKPCVFHVLRSGCITAGPSQQAGGGGKSLIFGLF
jgi:hypothetical protein